MIQLRNEGTTFVIHDDGNFYTTQPWKDKLKK